MRFWRLRPEKKDTVVCWQEIGSFFVVQEIFITTRKKKIHYDRKKKRYSRLSDGCGVLAITTGKKKDTVVCLAGCAVVLFFVVAGNFDYDRKKKIQLSVGRKLAVFLLRREIFITTGKKKIHYDRKKKRYSRLSDGCAVLAITTGKKKKIQSSVCWVRGSGDYDRKKKKIQSSV